MIYGYLLLLRGRIIITTGFAQNIDKVILKISNVHCLGIANISDSLCA